MMRAASRLAVGPARGSDGRQPCRASMAASSPAVTILPLASATGCPLPRRAGSRRRRRPRHGRACAERKRGGRVAAVGGDHRRREAGEQVQRRDGNEHEHRRPEHAPRRPAQPPRARQHGEHEPAVETTASSATASRLRAEAVHARLVLDQPRHRRSAERLADEQHDAVDRVGREEAVGRRRWSRSRRPIEHAEQAAASSTANWRGGYSSGNRAPRALAGRGSHRVQE